MNSHYGTITNARERLPNFYLSGAAIIDLQRDNMSDAIWATLNPGDYFSEKVIYERITMTDCCGNPVVIDLGSRTHRRKKISATEWWNEID